MRICQNGWFSSSEYHPMIAASARNDFVQVDIITRTKEGQKAVWSRD